MQVASGTGDGRSGPGEDLLGGDAAKWRAEARHGHPVHAARRSGDGRGARRRCRPEANGSRSAACFKPAPDTQRAALWREQHSSMQDGSLISWRCLLHRQLIAVEADSSRTVTSLAARSPISSHEVLTEGDGDLLPSPRRIEEACFHKRTVTCTMIRSANCHVVSQPGLHLTRPWACAAFPADS